VTLCLEGRCSIQLSYGQRTSKKSINRAYNWSGWRDSNSRHPAPKAGALPGYATPRTRKYSLITTFGQTCFTIFILYIGKFINIFYIHSARIFLLFISDLIKMSAKIIDGKKIANDLLENIKKEIATRENKGHRAPKLVVILIGANPASKIYVDRKIMACKKTGIKSISHNLKENITQNKLLKLISDCNQDKEVDGILVQSPLPPHIDEEKIIETIDPKKDVDGFTPHNIGLLAIKKPILRSCTPYGVIKMLDSLKINLEGLDAIIIGQSNHVGRPMFLELLLAKCTVTICHSKTKNIEEKISQADIVVSAVGKPNFIKGNWIKNGSIIIDIGITRLNNNKIVGDVEFDVAKEKAAFITPVPGGVGPMTVATLMENTLIAQKLF
jgi:methylenetetrahydrofolate dehydrogenase (NADP+) / methenyltetrahydrofolate cyclohydrolase